MSQYFGDGGKVSSFEQKKRPDKPGWKTGQKQAVEDRQRLIITNQ